MKFSEKWLRSWANPQVSHDELVARLSMVGLEVDADLPVAGAFSGVVVGDHQGVGAQGDFLAVEQDQLLAVLGHAHAH
ncbi:MAG: hypothetical protein E7H04_29850, partial [Pseudomonas aeruginosa]|nr:hypothetical protein [Pseudomonas aeruginosa]